MGSSKIVTTGHRATKYGHASQNGVQDSEFRKKSDRAVYRPDGGQVS